ncbi:dihydrofolate reductase [Fulvivirga sp. 29W222]|uniref:Dihydrofolate reductase n=1 Tax=Fulvivirga marina TaxID=2494733 RepID=A0A937FZK9_9BACT|nr:dihydrofolate reductase family protein [Fulvivirga marina]MBL6447762.1 dihydrofolate reductase [Fulvivirga marina]
MRKLTLYIATSLNGKIAKNDGAVDWLDAVPNPEKSDYGYYDFYKGIDTTIMGYKTYDQIINWGIDFPYAGKKNYVFTRKKELSNTEHVEFVSEDHTEFVKNLKQQNGSDIWLIGGGQINTLLFDADLIDEIRLFVMPIVISGGIELFEGKPAERHLLLKEHKAYSSGVTELIYEVNKNTDK